MWVVCLQAELFAEQRTMNADISGWDVSNVENMERMFDDAVVLSWVVEGQANVLYVSTSRYVQPITGIIGCDQCKLNS